MAVGVLMKNTIYLNTFSKEPFGRYESDGPFSGEIFRKTKLLPAIKNIAVGSTDVIEIDIDNIDVDLGSSFLEEAFGGLVRYDNIPRDIIKNHIIIKSQDDFDKKRIIKYINEAFNRNLTV